MEPAVIEKSNNVINFKTHKNSSLSFPEYEYLIEKSNVLIYANFSSWSDLEKNLLEIYLSKINPRDDKSIQVKIDKKEVERLLQVKRIHNKDFKDAITSLTKKFVKINKVGLGGSINLFDAGIFKETKGNIEAYICCSATAKKYMFNISNIGYIRYRLRESIILPTFYAKKLYFLCLCHLNFKNIWSMTIDEFREYFELTDKYPDIKILIRTILKPSIQAVEDKTDIGISYTKILDSKHRIIAFEFSVNPKVKYKEIVQTAEGVNVETKINDNILLYLMKTLNLKNDKDAESIINKAIENNVSNEELKKRVDYALKRKETITNIVRYIIAILDNNKWQENKEKQENNIRDFDNFEQRKLDDELDEMEELFLQEINGPKSKNTGSN